MSAHRYWRIYISAPSGYCGFAEIELRASIGGSDETGSGTATASSQYSTDSAPKAVDNNTATWWTSANVSPPHWWAYDFGVGVTKDIVEVAITPRASWSSRCPVFFTLQYSDNNSDWTDYYTWHIVWSGDGQKVFNALTPGAKRYWKLYNQVSGFKGFAELEMRESSGGADQTGSGTASASTGTAANGVDNNTTTYWQSNNTLYQWWAYDFGAGVTKNIVELLVTPRAAPNHTYTINDFYLMYSDDGVIYVILGHFTHTWIDGDPQVFTILSPTTEAPTVAPTTIAPTTLEPTTLPPTTLAPTSLPPTTLPPTQAPTTVAPTSLPPTTLPPTTVVPPTPAPTTIVVTTFGPTTAVIFTTKAPTTPAPTTLVPTTPGPTTRPPTTSPPTTLAPTTLIPPTTEGWICVREFISEILLEGFEESEILPSVSAISEIIQEVSYSGDICW